ncbi:MAG: hypothetical protein WCG05_04490 [Alphaproteobacteria bacterium]
MKFIKIIGLSFFIALSAHGATNSDLESEDRCLSPSPDFEPESRRLSSPVEGVAETLDLSKLFKNLLSLLEPLKPSVVKRKSFEDADSPASKRK